MPRPPHVLIFDSGAGALAVFGEVARLNPGVRCSLTCDNAFFPYGSLPEPQLLRRVVDVVGHMIEEISPDLAVIACNTASTLVLEQLRRTFDIPFVGVVPAIKPAAQISRNQIIGLLATPATISRSYTDNLIQDFAPGCTIVRLGSSRLVYMAEQKLRARAVDLDELGDILTPFSEIPNLDTLVLACTHFPLLAEEIRLVLPQTISLVDSGEAIARRIRSLLKHGEPPVTEPEVERAECTPVPPELNHQLYVTSSDSMHGAVESHYRQMGIEHMEVQTI